MTILTIVLISFVVTFILIPIARRTAISFGVYDKPNEIKAHKAPTPYLGGVAILLGFVLSLSFVIFFSHLAQADVQKLLVILLGGVAFSFLGLIDDIISIDKAYIKLFIEIIIVSLVFSFGIGVNLFTSIPLNFLLTIFWFIFITHAFNNIDGLDGLSGGIAFIISVFWLFIIFLGFSSSISGFVVSGAIVGASAAYLVFNLPPAKIFMGDAGSLFLGFVLSSIPLLSINFYATPSRIIPVVIVFAYIIFDSTFVIIKRLMSHRSIFTGDLNHTYNLIQNKTNNVKKTLVIVYGLSAVLIIIASVFLKLNIF